MKASELKIGDRIRITCVPGKDIPGYYIHPDTVRAYKKVIARGRSVRISRIDDDGTPWFDFWVRHKSGRREHHFLTVRDEENNWVTVKPRKK